MTLPPLTVCTNCTTSYRGSHCPLCSQASAEFERAFGKPDTQEGPNRDVSAGISHSDPDGSASKPGTASHAGATQNAAPIHYEFHDHRDGRKQEWPAEDISPRGGTLKEGT